MILQAGARQFVFPRPALIMGVLNVTPDSFSDGGLFLNTSAAVDQALRLEAAGAEIIDVGGESTRPGAAPVGLDEELRRVMPVLESLAGRVRAVVSIDTRKPQVARAALETGAGMVNDSGAARPGGEMAAVLAGAQAAYVIMHSKGDPETMQHKPVYEDAVGEVEGFFRSMMAKSIEAGLNENQLVLDVGVGFGKTLEHNLSLLRATKRFAALGRPLMLGFSRKSFMGALLGLEVMERLPAALACAAWAVQSGAGIIRTHDAAETRAAVRMMEAIIHAP